MFKCLFGHKWKDFPERGIYDGIVISYRCSICGEYIPHWTDKAKKIKDKLWKKNDRH